MTRRHFVNNAPQLTLSASITSSATSLTVSGSFSGWPTQFPYFATLDLGLLSEEIILVSNVVGTTATITRAQDGTPAVSHAAGATLDFTVVAADFDEANSHVNSNSGVHGVSGSVVGTNDTQTLSNKTLSSPTLTGTLSGAGAINTTGSITTTAGVTGATVAATGGVSGASFTAAANGKLSGVLASSSYTSETAATTAGANVTGAVVWLTAPTTGPVGLYVYSGTAWVHISSGGFDTGWVNMTSIQAGWSNDSTVPQARQIGDVVYMVGGVVNATFNSTGFTTAIFLPSAVAAPPNTRVLKIARSSTSLSSEARLLVDRSVQVNTSAASGNAFRFDGMFYVAN